MRFRRTHRTVKVLSAGLIRRPGEVLCRRRMPHLPGLICLLVFLAASAAWADVLVDSEVDRLLESRIVGNAEIAVYAVDLATNDVLIDRQGETPLIPASNLKLITTGSALLTLGPDFAFKTTLLRDGDRIILKGSGDPGLGDPELLHVMNLTIDDLVDFWVDDMVAEGITNVRELVIDDRVFDDSFHHSDWMAEDLIHAYGAQVAGFNLFGNTVKFYFRPGDGEGSAPTYSIEPDISRWIRVDNKATTRTGGSKSSNTLWLDRRTGENEFIVSGRIRLPAEARITIHDPAETYAPYIAQRMRRKGITVQNVRSASDDEELSGEPFGRVIQTRMDTLLERANTDSENLYAEALLKRIGYEATGQQGSWSNGAAVVRALIAGKLGPALATQIIMSDGSGLSRENRITARLLVEWLKLMNEQDEAISSAFYQSLAEGGESGTLRRRFQNVEVDGDVHAKSGFMRGISCLSGYLKSKNDRTIAFSVLVNDLPPNIPTAKAKELQERIVRVLDRYLQEHDTLVVTQTADDAEDDRPKFGG